MNFVEIRRRLCWWKTPGNMECQLIFLLACVVAVQSNPCLVRQKRAFPHEESCGKYLICKRGVPVEHDCPDDLHFDTETLNCRPRQLAQCGISTPNMETHVERKPLPTVPPTPAIVTCKPPDTATSERTISTPAYSTTTQSTATEDALLTTSGAPSSTTVVPITTSDVQLSSSEVPKTTSDVQPSMSEVPESTSNVRSSSSEVPKTTSDVQPSSSEVPKTTSDDQLSSSEVPKTTSDVQPLMSEVPKTTSNVHSSSSEVPKTTSNVQPSSSVVPNTTSEVQPSSSEVSKTTSDVKPSSEVSKTTSDVQSSSSVVPKTTSDVQPSSSEIPKTTSDVQPSTFEVSKTTSEVQPSSFVVPKTTSEVSPSNTMVPKTTSVVSKTNYDVPPSTSVVSKMTSDIPSSSNAYLTTSTELQSLITEFSTTSSELPRSPNTESPTSNEIPSSTTDVLEKSEKPTTSSNSTNVPSTVRHPNYLCNNNKKNYYVIPDPEDFKYFYYCIFGIPFFAKCPKNFEFSRIDLKCLPATVAGYNQTSTSIPYNKTVTLTVPPESTTSELPLITSNLSTMATAPTSSPNFIPNEAPPSTAEFPRPTTEVPATTAEFHNSICNNTNNYYFVPDSKDCNRFYILCENGNMIQETCPLDYEFSPQFLECLPAVVAGCNHTTTPAFAFTVTTSTVSPVTDTSEVSITTYRASTITPKYTSYPDITITEISSTTPEVSLATTVLPPTTAESLDHTCDTSKYFLSPDPNDCRQFYLCAYGKLIHVACPLDYEFSSQILVCLPPSVAGCIKTTDTTHAPTTTGPTVPNTSTNEILTTTIELAATTAEIPKTTFDVPSTATEITQSTKPPNNLCKNTSQNYYIVSDPEDCKYFYICIFGIPLHGKCTKNDEFSPIDLECMPAALAKCNHTTTTALISAATTSIPMTTAATLLQDPTTTQDLPSTTGIPTITIESTTSPKITTTEVSSTTTEPSKPICEDTYKYYYAPDPKNCRRFYICAYGKPDYETCPLDYEFNSQLMECLPAAVAGCNHTTTITSNNANTASIHMRTTSTLISDATKIDDSPNAKILPIITTELTTSPKITTIDSSKTTELSSHICKNTYKYYYAPDPRNCSRYYICAYGIADHETCPLDYEFNSLLMECLPAALAGCNYTTNTHNNKTTTPSAQLNTPISEVPTITAEPTFLSKITTTKLPSSTTEAIKVLSLTTDLSSTTVEHSDYICKENTNKYYYAPDPKDCRRYYVCNYGKINHKTCPLNYEFSPLSLVCLPSSIAACNHATITASTTIRPAISDTTSSVDTATTQQTPTINFKFTPTTTKVSKTSSEVPTTTRTTTAFRTLNILCKNKISNYFVVPDPEDCNYYYLCIFGISFLAKCTENDEFSPVDLKCLPAATAGCNHTTSKTMTSSTTPVPSTVIPTLTADTTTLKVPRITTEYIPRPYATTDEVSTTTTIDVLPSNSKIPHRTIDVPTTIPKSPHGTIGVPTTTFKIPHTTVELATKTSKIPSVNIDVPTTIPKIPHGTINVPTTTSKIIHGTVEVPTITSKIPPVNINEPTTISKISHGTIEVPTTTSKIQPVNIDVPTTISKNPHGTIDVPTTNSKITSANIDVPTTTSKIPPVNIDVPTTISKIPHGTIEVPTTISKIIHGTIEIPKIPSKIPHGTFDVPTISFKDPTETTASLNILTTYLPKTTSAIQTTSRETEIAKQFKPQINTCKNQTDIYYVIPDPDDCKLFYICVFGVPIHGKCSRIGDDFSPSHLDCMPSAMAECNLVTSATTISTTSTTLSTTTTEPNTATIVVSTTSAIPFATTEVPASTTKASNHICNNLYKFYVIADPEDCKRFFLCIYGKLLHEKCPKDYEFSSQSLECLPAAVAGCNYISTNTSITSDSTVTLVNTTRVFSPTTSKYRPTTELLTTATMIPMTTIVTSTTEVPYLDYLCKNNRDNDYTVPDPDDCEYFYNCNNGVAFHKKCPLGYEFSTVHSECLPTSIAGCNHATTTISCDQINADSSISSSIPSSIITHSIPHSITEDLTSTTLNSFSPTDSPRPATEIPHSTTTPTLPTTVPPTSSKKCNYTNEQPIYYLPDKENCRQYYMCYYGDLYGETCPKDFEFSLNYMVCLPPDQAQCNFTHDTKSATTSHQLDQCTQDSPVHYYADITNCNAYYICYHGISYHQKCPPQYNYDKVSLKCIPEAESKCYITEQ